MRGSTVVIEFLKSYFRLKIIVSLAVAAIVAVVTAVNFVYGERSALTVFPAASETIDVKYLQVFEVVEPDMALARGGNERDIVFDRDAIDVLLVGEGANYYDKQRIDVPDGKKVRRVGTYKKYGKTLPAVRIE